MKHTELIMRRKNVREFIAADPMTLVVMRGGNRQRSEAGGFVKSKPEPLAHPHTTQRARIVLNKRRYNPGVVNSEAGDIPHTDYLLIGMHTLNLEPEDEFQFRGDHYKVVGIHNQRTESVLAAIDFLGPKNVR